MTIPSVPRYLEKLLASGWVPPPGEVVEVMVYHDDWCAQLNGNGECNCDPDVELVTSKERRA